MCIAVFMWQTHPLYPFLLLLNRDEYHNRQLSFSYIFVFFFYFFFKHNQVVLSGFSWTFSRATKEVGWWDGGEIIGGRDEVAGGTWLASSKQGRVAFLTNVLELDVMPQAKTRGDLVIRFLQVHFLLETSSFAM